MIILPLFARQKKLQKSDQGFSKLLENTILRDYTWILYLDTILRYYTWILYLDTILRYYT